ALDDNAVVYELATRALWSPMPPLDRWLPEYAARRWGARSPEVRTAWDLLARTLYGPGRTRATPSPLIARPWSQDLPFASPRLAPGAALRRAAPLRGAAAHEGRATIGEPRCRERRGNAQGAGSAGPGGPGAGTAAGSPGLLRSPGTRCRAARPPRGCPVRTRTAAGDGRRRPGRGRAAGPSGVRLTRGAGPRRGRRGRHPAGAAGRPLDRRRPRLGRRRCGPGRCSRARRPVADQRLGHAGQRPARLLGAALVGLADGSSPPPVACLGGLALRRRGRHRGPVGSAAAAREDPPDRGGLASIDQPLSHNAPRG